MFPHSSCDFVSHQENQSILDDHVQRVFKTPPVQTPRPPSPPLERQFFAKMGLKSPYQMNTNLLRNVNNNRSTDIDSAIYTGGSSMSSTAPMTLPRGRGIYPVVDSGCDYSVVNAPIDNLNEKFVFLLLLLIALRFKYFQQRCLI